MSRVKTARIALSVGASLVALTSVVVAQQPAQPLSVKPLKGDVYWGQGGAGGNSTIIVGKTSVIVVDAKTNADSAKELVAEIAKMHDQAGDQSTETASPVVHSADGRTRTATTAGKNARRQTVKIVAVWDRQ